MKDKGNAFKFLTNIYEIKIDFLSIFQFLIEKSVILNGNLIQKIEYKASVHFYTFCF